MSRRILHSDCLVGSCLTRHKFWRLHKGFQGERIARNRGPLAFNEACGKPHAMMGGSMATRKPLNPLIPLEELRKVLVHIVPPVLPKKSDNPKAKRANRKSP